MVAFLHPTLLPLGVPHHFSISSPSTNPRPRFIRPLPQSRPRLPRPYIRPSSPFPAMTLQAAVATSANTDTPAAVAEAVSQATASLPGAPTAVLVLCTVDRDISHLQSALREHLPDVPIHAATSCAAALTNAGPRPNAISILALHAPGQIAVSQAPVSADRPLSDAVLAVSTSVLDQLGKAPANLLLFSSPGSEEAVLSAMKHTLPNTAVFGGSAADNTVEGKWSIFSADHIFDEGLSVLALSEEVKFGSALVPPYVPTNESAVITAASGRSIKTLDGKPAAEVLHSWIGSSIDEQAASGGNIIVQSATHPLGITRGGRFVGIHAAEIAEDGSVGLFAEVQKGDTLTVMKGYGDGDSATAAALGLEQAYDDAKKDGDIADPKAGVMIYCGGLSIAVGDALGKSLEPMKDKAPLVGMTAFGEQGCYQGINVHSNLAVGIALFE